MSAPEKAFMRLWKPVSDLVDSITMRLGLWLIGERETPNEKEIARRNKSWLDSANCAAKIYQDERDEAIRERNAARCQRDEAIKERDTLRNLHEIGLLSAKTWGRKYDLLRKRHAKLRDRLIDKTTPKRKRRTKR